MLLNNVFWFKIMDPRYIKEFREVTLKKIMCLEWGEANMHRLLGVCCQAQGKFYTGELQI